MELGSLPLDNLADSNATFPQKLFVMMEIEDGDIVHWAPHGFAFVVTNQERFLKDIVPKYFKHTKLTSFQRQLNLYGFRRLTKGEDQGAYFHPKFQRSRREMMAEIKRLPPKGSLQTLEQVMNANRQLPSERFGGTKKRGVGRSAPTKGGMGMGGMSIAGMGGMVGMGHMGMSGMGMAMGMGMGMDMDMGMGLGMGGSDISIGQGQVRGQGQGQAGMSQAYPPGHPAQGYYYQGSQVPMEGHGGGYPGRGYPVGYSYAQMNMQQQMQAQQMQAQRQALAQMQAQQRSYSESAGGVGTGAVASSAGTGTEGTAGAGKEVVGGGGGGEGNGSSGNLVAMSGPPQTKSRLTMNIGFSDSMKGQDPAKAQAQGQALALALGHGHQTTDSLPYHPPMEAFTQLVQMAQIQQMQVAQMTAQYSYQQSNNQPQLHQPQFQQYNPYQVRVPLSSSGFTTGCGSSSSGSGGNGGSGGGDGGDGGGGDGGGDGGCGIEPGPSSTSASSSSSSSLAVPLVEEVAGVGGVGLSDEAGVSMGQGLDQSKGESPPDVPAFTDLVDILGSQEGRSQKTNTAHGEGSGEGEGGGEDDVEAGADTPVSDTVAPALPLAPPRSILDLLFENALPG